MSRNTTYQSLEMTHAQETTATISKPDTIWAHRQQISYRHCRAFHYTGKHNKLIEHKLEYIIMLTTINLNCIHSKHEH